MPVARYFLFVGGVLLALLVVIGSYAPQPPVETAVNSGANTDSDKPFIRINSERKWPEAVVYDTTHPPAVAAPVVAANIPAPAPEVSANARVREAYAQFQPSDPKQMHSSKQVQAQVQPQQPPAAKIAQSKPQPKRRVARNRMGPPMMMAAQQQQPRFGFFFNNTW
jgi:hypothetical protein